MFDAQKSHEAEFLQKHFQNYYLKHFIDSVPQVRDREFGFGIFKRKIANRNMAFSSVEEINSFLRSNVPLFFSYSNAYYAHPERTPMTAKVLVKADLIYEFDADELGLEVPVINDIQWFNSDHLKEAKRQVFRLIDFIEGDFGFSKDFLAVNFSGKAGYHVHLRSEEIHSLNKKARIELVDYLTAHNMDFGKMGFDLGNSLIFPINKGLWTERFAKGIETFLNQDPKVVSKIVGMQKKKIAVLFNEKEKLFDSIKKGKLLPIEGKKSAEFWKCALMEIVKKEMVPVDRQTSIDVHKIVRVPETLHGDTGLLAKTIPLDDLKSFDPLKDAVVFDSTPTSVHVIKSPKFSLGGESFGPFENELVNIPLFAAIYLVGKGAAVLQK